MVEVARETPPESSVSQEVTHHADDGRSCGQEATFTNTHAKLHKENMIKFSLVTL